MARAPRPGNGRDHAKSVHDFQSAEQWWRARPDTELHATGQKKLMTFDSKSRSDGDWPVYKGESFDLWTPDTGNYYARANPEPVFEWLQGKRIKGHRNSKSPHSEFSVEHVHDRSTLPCFRPRIAFRDITNRTNQRTIIACLIPPKVFITNTGPYFLWPRGDEKDQAYLLGVLCSIPLDWYARRYVEMHVNFFIINPFPIPRPSRDDLGWKRVVNIAGRLACPDDRFAAWAKEVDVECGPLDAEKKEDMIHELDAVVAHLYNLDENQLVHIFETFHEGWDYQKRLDGALRHFEKWKSK